ncbi:hypothetical protein E0Z10_g5626 [Xylaria hypoxylon]|uniref:Replication factor C subunit 1 n=1 Tax=Xylaria hypoxylon TaxID=37992 RepID=A0A4Z0YI55_9PEZI|nr:hypothetical protein E0Z10_g5626 [Xylaria hypoxylon]
MPDIRSFFGAKGGAAPAKPSASKTADAEPPKKRTKGRKVVEDSDDDDEPVVEQKKLATRSTPRKKQNDKEIEGTATTASEYFASSKPKAQQPSKPTAKPAAKPEAKPHTSTAAEVRASPRVKRTTTKTVPTDDKTTRKHGSTTTRHNNLNSDEDAFMDDDEDAGDDIFAADARSRSKRKNDDYAEEESEEEFLPKAKRFASRNKLTDDDDKSITKNSKDSKRATTTKKRKTPEPDSNEEEDDDEEEPPSRKKPAAKKPRAPRAKKAAEPEDADVQAIFDDIPTVRPPTPPSKDPNKKFDWKKAAAGGGNSGPPPNPIAEDLPTGEPDCLVGLTFVFTGQLSSIAREEAQALVKRHGGKITGAPSSKTSYVVLGDDAGPSKLAKIREHGIKTINEEGLFALIRRLPAGGGSGKGAEKVKQKRKEEEEKIKKQAAEMEHEEKRRRAEEEKAQKAAVARGATTATQAAQPPSALLWTVKYAPTQASHICGNKAAVERIQKWLKGWPQAKRFNFQKRGADGMGGERAVILSGPPGIGKTTAAHLAAKLEGYDVIESNASDARSKKLVESGVSEVMNNTSLHGYFASDGKKIDKEKKRIVLIMDEVDGMSAGDRGGVAALAKFCKKTEVPLILICNERKLQKMKPFDFVTYDVKFQRPQVDQIRSRMMTICHREGLKLPLQVLDALIEGTNRDIRQIVNMLATIKLDQISMDFDQGKDMSKAWEKSIVLKPWDICQKMLAGGLFLSASKSTLNDKIELYFNDHETSYLMIQENYLRTKPSALSAYQDSKRERNLKLLEMMDQAAESISDGDLVDRMIHGPQQHWSLMPTHAVFSTVRPASFVSGQLLGSNFTSWLGNNSKYGKLGRCIREIHSHMRLKSSGDHNEIRQQYLPILWTQLIKRLEEEGKDSVEEVIKLMDSYFLTREDFDSIKELGVGPQNEEAVSIDTQTKSTFTRLYNSMSHPIPFMKASAVVASKNVTKDKPDLEEAMDDGDEAEAPEAAQVVNDEDEDITKDKYIKKPKAKAAKRAPKKASKTEADDDEDDDKPKGRGRKAGGVKGKSKNRAALHQQHTSTFGTVGSSEIKVAARTVTGHHKRHATAHGKDDIDFVPQVPRIPDRFQPRKENHDLGFDQGSVRNSNDEKKVDMKSIPAPHIRYLPNCSFGKPKEVQVVSNAMMQAYVAMRGNYLGGQDGNDPLFKWIQQREELAQPWKPKIDHTRDVSRMLLLIDKALESSNMGGDSPRDCLFEVYRPDFEHIKAPQSIDMSPHVFAASCNEFEWEGDSDDEEADVPSGRISPCTFLEWSQDCVRWNADEIEDKKDTASYLRMRPPTPNVPAPPRQHEYIPSGRFEAQWDIYTGEELTPTYYVPTSPSIIYTPPGVDFTGFRTPNFHAQYRRMVPLVERELRSKLYGGQEVLPNLSDGERDRFSPSEVDAAAAVVPELHSLRGPEIEAVLRDQWATIMQTEEAERALYKHAELQKEHIKRLQFDQRHLNEFLPALHMRREMRDRIMQEEMERRRGNKIRAYVAEHALEAQSRLDMAWFRLNCTQAKVHENMLRITGLEEQVRDLCDSGGVRDPEHAYAVLMGAESSGGDPGYGADVTVNGFGGADGPIGPWSASSLGRAEEEFDHFLPGTQTEGATTSEANGRGSEGRCDDDVSGDSGVAGVGS